MVWGTFKWVLQHVVSQPMPHRHNVTSWITPHNCLRCVSSISVICFIMQWITRQVVDIVSTGFNNTSCEPAKCWRAHLCESAPAFTNIAWWSCLVSPWARILCILCVLYERMLACVWVPCSMVGHCLIKFNININRVMNYTAIALQTKPSVQVLEIRRQVIAHEPHV